MTLVMGAVAYDPKVVTIWGGFRAWLRARDLDFDFVLYSQYERQVEDLVAGRIAAAWNSPLAWVRAERLARARERALTPLVMRDTDQDLTSVVVVRADSPYKEPADLKGETVGVGAVDSPQATLIPGAYLRSAGLRPGEDVRIRRFDVGVGLHGDHVGGERDAARALMDGEVAAACMIDGNHLAFGQEGTLPPGGTRIIGRTPAYDHCNMTVGDAGEDERRRFEELLLSMSYADPEVRPLLDLEGLTAWRPGRTEGYALLDAAVDEAGFYDAEGAVTAAEYAP
ncbi:MULTISPECIES: phosphate/phosphite/phosphonate ABC transporter substrate-binding protein [Actinomadura]|uniref:PhnD/SsuA/transferrin family substrate-binding protein n=1 Tax=Actinomadura litoris TaxID=2678616 RepID=A0A7K1LES6_9ACTN|nr:MULTISPECIES: PhnD/SsuA/transferrin family substrate-binding protein [Actinomadura]MBT2212745.1 PhnD/SsuA/transferrin family substrate-binding protein [Actinomadura sp. NEAU-AAG7]MUN42695.1 PhnD/SsuA/transferrin family substrate-binding protein [Actinomadura litoris]